MLKLEMIGVREKTPTSVSVGVGLSVTIINLTGKKEIRYILTMNHSAVTVNVDFPNITSCAPRRHVVYLPAQDWIATMNASQYTYELANCLYGTLELVGKKDINPEIVILEKTPAFSEAMLFIRDAVYLIATQNFAELKSPLQYAVVSNEICNPNTDSVMVLVKDWEEAKPYPYRMSVLSKRCSDIDELRKDYDRVYEIDNVWTIEHPEEFPTTITMETSDLFTGRTYDH